MADDLQQQVATFRLPDAEAAGAPVALKAEECDPDDERSQDEDVAA